MYKTYPIVFYDNLDILLIEDGEVLDWTSETDERIFRRDIDTLMEAGGFDYSYYENYIIIEVEINENPMEVGYIFELDFCVARTYVVGFSERDERLHLRSLSSDEKQEFKRILEIESIHRGH